MKPRLFHKNHVLANTMYDRLSTVLSIALQFVIST